MVEVSRGATALVVVDMQNGFCHPDGSFGQAGADVSGCNAAIGPCIELVDAAHAAGVPVYFTRAIHESDLSDWNMLQELPMYAGLRDVGSCEEGSWDAEFVDGLPVTENDVIVTKSRFSPFVETDIADRLRDAGITTLVCCGVGTSACVESTVRDASQRSFRPIVAEEATGDISAEAHTNSLHIMGSLFGYTRSVSEIVSSWATP
jgi:ureidoacrylate peracid hydrolase